MLCVVCLLSFSLSPQPGVYVEYTTMYVAFFRLCARFSTHYHNSQIVRCWLAYRCKVWQKKTMLTVQNTLSHWNHRTANVIKGLRWNDNDISFYMEHSHLWTFWTKDAQRKTNVARNREKKRAENFNKQRPNSERQNDGEKQRKKRRNLMKN